MRVSGEGEQVVDGCERTCVRAYLTGVQQVQLVVDGRNAPRHRVTLHVQDQRARDAGDKKWTEGLAELGRAEDVQSRLDVAHDLELVHVEGLLGVGRPVGGLVPPREVGRDDQANEGKNGRDDGPDTERQTFFALGRGGDGLLDKDHDDERDEQPCPNLDTNRVGERPSVVRFRLLVARRVVVLGVPVVDDPLHHFPILFEAWLAGLGHRVHARAGEPEGRGELREAN